ncbi:hypothetical protein F4X90_01505 [Candidatus Poribacteria bacterium]|nr:hypothetical protein [Candidatus Poribacteria bacterium]
MGIIDWLNTNSGVIIGIATVVLVGITGIYVYLTWRLLKANNTPEIAISLRPHEAHIHCVMLCIENIGRGAARDIQFQTDLSFKPDGERALEEVGFLKNGIDYLGPKEKIEHFLVSVIGKLDKLKETPLEIGVTYTDSVDLKRRHKRAFRLDFGEDEGFATIGRSPLFEIAKATQEIQKDLRHVTTGFHKPIILTEPLSKHHLGSHVNALEIRVDQFPHEIQQEILQELDAVVSKREQEIQEKERNQKTETVSN